MDPKSLVKQLNLREKISICIQLVNWRTFAIPRLNIPSIIMIDGPNGINKKELEFNKEEFKPECSKKAISFPSACCSCCSFDLDIMFKMGEAIGEEMVKDGISLIFGRGVNIKRSPLGGRNFEYFSEDPFLTTKMAGALIKRIQTKGVGACIKHFTANNQETKRFFISAEVDERTFREIYLSAFEDAIKDAKPWAIMSAYNSINGVHSSVNKYLLTTILRDEWKWSLNTDSPNSGGIVISDWFSTYDRIEGFKAGLDLSMPYEDIIDQIIDSVQKNELDEKFIDQSAERVLNIVCKANEIIEKSKTDESIQFGIGMDKIEGFLDKHHEIACEIAENSIVLLQNNDSILPLPLINHSSKSINVLFVGQFSKEPHFQGRGSAHVDEYKINNCYDCSLDLIKLHNNENKNGNIILSYSQGFDSLNGKATSESKAEAIEASSKADIIVIFAGTPIYQEEENQDLKSLNFPFDVNDLIESIASINNNVVVVLQNGSAVEMPWINDVKGILEPYFCGESGGKATVNILFGLVNPSGHLGETFPINLSDNPTYYNFPGKGDKVKYSEGLFVGYRYYDTYDVNVLFPFGFGLS